MDKAISKQSKKDEITYNPGGPKLLIVESPAKIDTIRRFLTTGMYQIMSTYGHIKDLPSKAEGLKVDSLNQTVELNY